MFVISIGNPFDGLTLYGPFEDCELANEWADNNVRDVEWCVVEVHSGTES